MDSCLDSSCFVQRGIDSVMDEVRLLDFAVLGDERGKLVALEENDSIPFVIKRLFYIFGSDRTVVRGQHANRESEFVLINLAGSSKIRVINTTGEEEVFILDCPTKGLYLPRMTWKEMFDFSEDSVLLVLASTHYSADEYIRDYDVFVKESTKG